ncbi:MAG: citrate synthase [Clostridiales bacterium]|nr:citrate synthase [Candidatus Cacconaster stercorequi]
MEQIAKEEYCRITPQIEMLLNRWEEHGHIDRGLYQRYDVKRGLRDATGRGVLASLTRISEVKGYTIDDGDTIPCEGVLYYRGVDVRQLVKGALQDQRFGFEETVYLLLFGELPDAEELKEFRTMLAEYRQLPKNFVRDVVMKAPTGDMMNTLSRSILTLYCYDDKANDTNLANVLRQCLQLTENTAQLAIYSYQAYRNTQGEGLYLHAPRPELSVAENILYMLREDKQYTELEARALDAALILHADHGSNNSTFTNHVVSSTGTDTYSAIAASLCALKGPRHGGANIKVVQMMADMKEHISDWEDEDAIRTYLHQVRKKQAFDRSGLIYGMGHAVYSLSDPRAEVLRELVQDISREKGREKEMALYARVERLAKEELTGHTSHPVAVNVDFYSGFLYEMLGLPVELYTPLFAIARMAGWSAHRMEELSEGGKIIRPACKCIEHRRAYIPMSER